MTLKIDDWFDYADPFPIRKSERDIWADRMQYSNRIIPAASITSGDTLVVRFDYGGGHGSIYDCAVRRVRSFRGGVGHGMTPDQSDEFFRKLNNFYHSLGVKP